MRCLSVRAQIWSRELFKAGLHNQLVATGWQRSLLEMEIEREREKRLFTKWSFGRIVPALLDELGKSKSDQTGLETQTQGRLGLQNDSQTINI